MFVASSRKTMTNPKTVKAVRAQIQKEIDRRRAERAKQERAGVNLSLVRMEQRSREEWLAERLRKREEEVKKEAARKLSKIAEERERIQRHESTRRISLTYVSLCVCWFYGLTIEDLRSPSRERHIVLARQALSYWARELTACSYPDIGNLIGRDHTTILHGYRNYKKKKAHVKELRGRR